MARDPEAIRRAKARYTRSPKGKATRKRHREGPKYWPAQSRYLKSPKGKAATAKRQKRYYQSPLGHECEHRFLQTPKGKETTFRKRHSVLGRERAFRYATA